MGTARQRSLVLVSVLGAVAVAYAAWQHHRLRVEQAFLSGALVVRIEHAGFVANELRLVDPGGGEKLRRLLEQDLVATLGHAAQLVREGATVHGDGMAAPNLTEGMRRAHGYAATHELNPRAVAHAERVLAELGGAGAAAPCD
jgi:hypothetical protein